jgi:hypothetical protein
MKYTKKELESKAERPSQIPMLPLLPTFWILFRMNGKGVEWMDAELPVPNYLEHMSRGDYLIGWQIDGYFSTAGGIQFLNDAIARITLAMREQRPLRIERKPHIRRDLGHYMPKIYRLREITRSLPSLDPHGKAPSRADSFEDFTFWAIKFWVEDEIEKSGGPVVYERLEIWAFSQFVHKERSTIRAKCRSIWNWYNKRDWKLPKSRKGKGTMTRRERALKNSQAIANASKERVINAITGAYAERYKRKNGAWSIAKIARAANVARDTAKKYIQEYEKVMI